MTSSTQLTVLEYLGAPGRIISASKGQYKYDNPDNFVVFNSNLCTKKGKIWHGDLDLTVDEDLLKKVARALNETVYVLYESDARFENEKNPKLENAVYFTDGEVVNIGNKYTDYYERSNSGKLIAKPKPELSKEEKEKLRKEIANSYNREDFLEVELVPKEDFYGYDGNGSEAFDEEDYNLHNCFSVKKFFNNVNEETCPLANFQLFLKDELGLENPEDFTKYYMTKEDYVEMEKLTKIWGEVFHFDFLTEYQKQKSLMWHMFNYGPAHFREDPEWAQPGKLYYRKG